VCIWCGRGRACSTGACFLVAQMRGVARFRETALREGGVLQAAVEARDEGLVRFIGVTGHGLTVARMHARNLERFPIDSVLVPYNYAQMRDPVHAADFEALAALCAERGVAPSSHRRRLSSPGAAQHAGSLTVPSRPRDSPAGPVGRPILMDCG